MTTSATQPPGRRGLVQRWNESRVGRYAREARENDLGGIQDGFSAHDALLVVRAHPDNIGRAVPLIALQLHGLIDF